jgi:hypothetical protein
MIPRSQRFGASLRGGLPTTSVVIKELKQLLADPDSQWHEYRGRGPITKNQVAALLKDFEIRPVVVHPTKRADVSRHGYRAAQFDDAFARFLPPEPNIRTLKRGDGEKT